MDRSGTLSKLKTVPHKLFSPTARSDSSSCEKNVLDIPPCCERSHQNAAKDKHADDEQRRGSSVVLCSLKKSITENYPFVKCETIGYSHLGREITVYSFGGGKSLLVGGVHGSEYITSLLLMRYTLRMCSRVKRGDSPMPDLAVVICLNPDGTAISAEGAKSAGFLSDYVEHISHGDTRHWQANALGVDINHNFNAGWDDVKRRELAAGITRPCPSRYGGEHPASEPETQAIMNFCREHSEIMYAAAFHSQGEEIYYDFGENTPSRSHTIAEKLSKISGYRLAHPQGTAVGGGFKDWFIEEFHKPACTVEVGLGENPLPDSDLDDIYTGLEPMLDYIAFGKYEQA